MKRARRRRQKSTIATHCIVYICTNTVYRVPCFYSLMTDRCHSERLIEIERELENEIIEIKAILARRKTEIETRSKLPPRSAPSAQSTTRASDPSEAEGRRTSPLRCAGGCGARVAGLSLSVAARCCVRLVLLFIRLVRCSPCSLFFVRSVDRSAQLFALLHTNAKANGKTALSDIDRSLT